MWILDDFTSPVSALIGNVNYGLRSSFSIAAIVLRPASRRRISGPSLRHPISTPRHGLGVHSAPIFYAIDRSPATNNLTVAIFDDIGTVRYFRSSLFNNSSVEAK